jgi:ATP-dependent helicase HrpB
MSSAVPADPSALPITSVLPHIAAALGASGAVVIEAPPGAGKTTLVPLALLDAEWLGAGRVVLLEPRRVAARASARRMASLLGEEVGGTVGYVTRDDRRVSARTRIEVVTEGVLTRRLQSDPSLEGAAVVLFDEFHERSLQADLGLALVLEVRDALRPDLRVGVMSATLDGERVAQLIGGGCDVIRAEGRRYPVETRWRPRPRRSAPIAGDAAAAVREALDEVRRGDVLVFLPGAGAIRRTQRDLGDTSGDVILAPLFGALPPEEQDRALAPVAPGLRKVVLATDIAESSLTIEGVRVVIDSGLAREPRFDPGTGMTRLATVPISRASAEQRRGRAGRIAPGVCYRLWSEAEQHALAAHRTPEIAQVDLAGLALEVAAWGATEVSELRLLDHPPRRAYERARRLLRDIGALDDGGRITPHGEDIAALPTHPRLGHMIATAGRLSEEGLVRLACELAALLAERDVLSTSRRHPSSDLARRIDVLRGRRDDAGEVHHGRLRRVRREADRLSRQAGVRGRRRRTGASTDRTGPLLAVAYPDRIAQRRAGARGRFLLSNGRGGTIPAGDPLAGEDLLVVADVDAGGGEARIHRAAALDRADLDRVLGHRVERSEVVEWDGTAGDVTAERRTTIGAITLERTPIDARGDERIIAALLEGVRREGLRILDWSTRAIDLRDRLLFLHRTFGDPWPDVSDAALEATLEEWLAPFLLGARRRSDLAAVPLADALLARLDPGQLGRLDELAPSHIEVPSGSRIRLDYSSREVPVLPVRIQEMFGATTTPRVAGGRVPVLLQLLSPAQRPVQITGDLAGFWRRTYLDVRADLRGRYPKHHWPDDPVRARPTRGRRPR